MTAKRTLVVCDARTTRAGVLRVTKRRGTAEAALPGTRCEFAGPGASSPCGQYCLLKVHHTEQAALDAWKEAGCAHAHAPAMPRQP